MEHPNYPDRAKIALAKTFTVKRHDGCLELKNYPVGAIVRLHDIRSPLFYGDCPVGLYSGWVASAYILAAEPREIAGKSVEALYAEAAAWAEQFEDIAWVPAVAVALKEQWLAINELDPPDIAPGTRPSASAEGNPSPN